MYSFKLKGNKCLFRDGNFYVKKSLDSYFYVFNLQYLKDLIP